MPDVGLFSPPLPGGHLRRETLEDINSHSRHRCPGPAAAQSQETYRYDANGRLIAGMTARTSSQGFTRYALDDADNRTSRGDYAVNFPANAWRLTTNEGLVVGSKLTSQDSRFTLTAEASGDLVLRFGATTLWSAGTANGRSTFLRLSAGGVLTLYDPAEASLWATPAAGANAVLTLQNDGNLVLKNSGGSVVWQSNTCCH
jgi:hypothetical protein